MKESHQQNHWYLNELCPATWEYIDTGKLSLKKIKLLSQLKKFVDRLAENTYLSTEELQAIEERFGTGPSVRTWGEYFQSEIAEDHFDKSDEEFARIVETIQFDLIAAILIFQNKNEQFLAEVESHYYEASQKTPPLSLQDEEYLHLGLLQEYFEKLNLRQSKISEEDYEWFEKYGLAKAI